MPLLGRMLLFIAPIVLAAICKATIASAAGGEELATYEHHPAKLVDSSIDLLLTATAVLLGVLLYVRSGTTIKTPGKNAIQQNDLVICSGIQIAGLIFIFASTLGLPHVRYIRDNYETMATVWLPDAIGISSVS